MAIQNSKIQAKAQISKASPDKNPKISSLICGNFFQSWRKILLFFLATGLTLRLVLSFCYFAEIKDFPIEIAKAFAIGFGFDFLTLVYFAFIPLLYSLFIPNRVFNSKIHQVFLKFCYFAFLAIIIWTSFAEIVFFEEFQSRFNFIAVDYLIYTQEVIGNIVESYPILPLMAVIIAISETIFFFFHKKTVAKRFYSSSIRILSFALVALVVAIDFFFIEGSAIDRFFKNRYNKELAQNGIYQFFSALRNNQIDYREFYATRDSKNANSDLRNLILAQEPKTKFLNKISDFGEKNSAADSFSKNDRNLNPIARFIPAYTGKENHHNIMLVVMESMSSEYMASFGNQENLTPNLDSLAKKGIFFSNLKATGTRTVRGLEAISLAIPPTPGNSIVRRKNNENLFNISSPLRLRGYESKFIYGGNGYFDNMNYFFENNGFQIVDRKNFADEEISFANNWGVADEDLFRKAIKEADQSFLKGKPFLNFIMTTSNHRPYTYPDGKIDIAPKTGRNGAVKYADYAIGKLIEIASKKPWFDKTIFVFVSDHCAGSAGNSDVPLWRYQIPAIFYAPKIFKAQIYDKNMSQIDIAPTLLGSLNISYKSKFFGVDVLHNQSKFSERAFVSTYSDLGYFSKNYLALLRLKKLQQSYEVSLDKFGWNGSRETLLPNYRKQDIEAAINYYQVASDVFKNGALKDFSQDELKTKN